MKNLHRAALLLACLLLAMLCACTGKTEQDSSIVAFVADEPVTVQEYSGYAYDFLSQANVKFGTDPAADVNRDAFWTEEQNGIAPIEWVKEQADLRMRREKGMQVLAKQLGLIEKISFEEQLKAHEQENILREEKLDRGEVVYGPRQLTRTQFLSYWQSGIEQQLEDYIKYEIISPTKEEIEDCYRRNEPVVSAREFTAKIGVFSGREGERLSGTEEILFWLEGGASPEDTAAAIGADYRTETVKTQDAQKEDSWWDMLLPVLMTAEPQKPVLLSNGEVLLLLEKQVNSVGSLEENYAEFEDLCRTEQMQNYLEEALTGLAVEHTETYQQLTARQLRENGPSTVN